MTSSLSHIADNDVCILSSVRTPLGSMGGALSSLSATKLGSIVIKEALKRANISADSVNEVFFGNVLSAGIGQAPARQAALGAGISEETPCTTINKVCASGLKAVSIGAQSILLGHNDIVVVGGMESMSSCPFYIPKARFGYRYGHGQLIDGVQHDGLWDPYDNMSMGNCGDICANTFEITRVQQDQYAAESYRRAAYAQKECLFDQEIVPVTIKGRKSETIVKVDEEVGKVDFSKLSQLRPAFDHKKGSVTAGNASPISDGAAALVLMSGREVKKLSLTVIARIRGFADAATSPRLFTKAPSIAIPLALQRANIDASDVNVYEINEAFAAVALANSKILNLDLKNVNVFGGAVALGHPLGCSGARILVTLINVLQNRKTKIGCAAVCNGGGGATALVIERFE